jgi:AcrR family transcriptional regulator
LSNLSPRVLEKRRRILDAAREVMLKTGFRAATMEAIAKEASIAKPTLYAQFADKETLFEALIEELLSDKTEIFIQAFETDAPLGERVGNGLAEMFGAISDMLKGSPHAAELVNEPHRLGHKFKRADDEVVESLKRAFSDAGVKDGDQLAKVLLASGTGIVGKLPDGDAVRSAIRLLCDRVIRGSL